MITNVSLVQAFERNLSRQTPADYLGNLRIVEALYEEARLLKVCPPPIPLPESMWTSVSREPSMFTDVLERLASTLDNSDLPYMIIGGQAVLLYGKPRLTRDIDITLGGDVDRQSKDSANARQKQLWQKLSYHDNVFLLISTKGGTDADHQADFRPQEQGQQPFRSGAQKRRTRLHYEKWGR